MRADSQYFEQLLVNLVINAEQSWPSTTAHDRRPVVAAWRHTPVEFVDTGPGFDAGVSRSRGSVLDEQAAGAMGLGLTAAKRLVRADGGTLTLRGPSPAVGVRCGPAERCLTGMPVATSAERARARRARSLLELIARLKRWSLSISVVRLNCSRRAACRLLPPVFSRQRTISSRSSCETTEVKLMPSSGIATVAAAATRPAPDVLGQRARLDFVSWPVIATACSMAFSSCRMLPGHQ